MNTGCELATRRLGAGRDSLYVAYNLKKTTCAHDMHLIGIFGKALNIER